MSRAASAVVTSARVVTAGLVIKPAAVTAAPLKAARLRMDLLGLAAPEKSMSLQASVELDSENEALQAQLAEAYSAALAEREQELAGLRAHLATARSPGPPALTVLAGKAEQP